MYFCFYTSISSKKTLDNGVPFKIREIGRMELCAYLQHTKENDYADYIGFNLLPGTNEGIAQIEKALNDFSDTNI